MLSDFLWVSIISFVFLEFLWISEENKEKSIVDGKVVSVDKENVIIFLKLFLKKILIIFLKWYFKKIQYFIKIIF